MNYIDSYVLGKLYKEPRTLKYSVGISDKVYKDTKQPSADHGNALWMVFCDD